MEDRSTIVADLRRGMAAEAGGATSRDAAMLVGLGAHRYRVGRMVVALYDTEGFAPAIRERIVEAFTALTEESIERAWGMIEDLAERRFSLPKKWPGPPQEKADRGVSELQAVMSRLRTTCEGVAGTGVPLLTEAESIEALLEVKAAQAALKQLRRTISNGSSS